jgi:protein-tyrosine phosphatase
VVPFAVNTRDLGGLRGPAGRRVRPGLLFRGSAAAIGPLAARHGLRTVLDLRQESEFSGEHRPAGPDVMVRPVVCDRTVIKTSARPQPSDYLAYYRRMVRVAAPVAVELLDVLAQASRLPVLVCCSVGKDRTSVVCALTLRALGVRLADVVRDHALSGRLLRRDVPAARTIACLRRLDRGELAARTSVVGWTIGRSLVEVERAHGSTSRLLAEHGLTRSTVESARDVLFGRAPW